MVASFALVAGVARAAARTFLTQWRYKLPADYWDRYAERVMAVTKEQIQAAARKYLAQDRLQIVAVGDPARALDPLKKLGPVETYDENGQPDRGREMTRKTSRLRSRVDQLSPDIGLHDGELRVEHHQIGDGVDARTPWPTRPSSRAGVVEQRVAASTSESRRGRPASGTRGPSSRRCPPACHRRGTRPNRGP